MNRVRVGSTGAWRLATASDVGLPGYEQPATAGSRMFIGHCRIGRCLKV